MIHTIDATNTPDILVRAMAIRAALGLYVSVRAEDLEAARVAGIGVLSIYAKDVAQRDDYCARLDAAGIRYVTSQSAP